MPCAMAYYQRNCNLFDMITELSSLIVGLVSIADTILLPDSARNFPLATVIQRQGLRGRKQYLLLIGGVLQYVLAQLVQSRDT